MTETKYLGHLVQLYLEIATHDQLIALQQLLNDALKRHGEKNESQRTQEPDNRSIHS